MKTRFFVFLIAFSVNVFCQQDTIHSTIFSLTPRSSKKLCVNGLAMGAGVNISENNSIQKINGVSIEINPFSILILMFDDPLRYGFSNTSSVCINGLSIGTGHSNHNEAIAYSGLTISLFNSGYSCNGISVNGIYNWSTNLNGMHISALSNYSKKANGLCISFSNYSEHMNGLQLGITNHTISFQGIQLGVFNRTKQQKGLQIGFWNSNAKRSMPFINW